MPSIPRLASNFRSMWIKFESVDSSYTGTNGFGAIAKVENTVYTIHHVAFGSARSFPTAEESIQVSFPSTPDTARQMKPGLSALAVCTLSAPFTTSEYSSEKATVGSRYASQSHDYYVMAELLEVWIYDRKSGVIRAKLRPHE